MQRRLSFFLFYSFFWVLFFILAKLAFLVYNTEYTMTLDLTDFALIFFYGMRMDISVAAYILVLPALFLMLTPHWEKGRHTIFFSVYTISISFISALFITNDLFFYKMNHIRMNTLRFCFADNIEDLVAQIFVFIVLLGMVNIVYFKFLKNYVQNFTKRTWRIPLVFFFIAASLIIPVRGSLKYAPLNVAQVYFHESNSFANHAVLNTLWYFGHELINRSSNEKF